MASAGRSFSFLLSKVVRRMHSFSSLQVKDAALVPDVLELANLAYRSGDTLRPLVSIEHVPDVTSGAPESEHPERHQIPSVATRLLALKPLEELANLISPVLSPVRVDEPAVALHVDGVQQLGDDGLEDVRVLSQTHQRRTLLALRFASLLARFTPIHNSWSCLGFQAVRWEVG